MFKIQRFKDNLADDEIRKFLLQFDLVEELYEISLSDSSFSISLPVQSRQNVLVVVCHQLCDLDKHFFFLFLRHD